MLHVEQPDAAGRGDDDDRQSDDEKPWPTFQMRRLAASRMPALVVIVLTHGIALAHEAERQAVVDQEQIGRAEFEHHQRMR